tara:strand:+ start:501 stop:782 length:282 start_codon:yes stop_codon:yes gene_type:complete
MSKETIYCGGGKQVKGEYGTFRAIAINLTDLPKEHIFEYDGKKYIKLSISDKKEADQFGKDVSVSVNTWKPAEEKKTDSAPAPAQSPPDDLPF